MDAQPRAAAGGFIFRTSPRDVIPLAVTLAQLALTFTVAAHFEAWSAGVLTALFPVQVMLAWYNPIISTHNFLHHPFFRARALNAGYAALNSVNLGLPQILYHFHHLNHHAYCNDRRDAEGRTRDLSSTYAYGRGGAQEGPLSYALLGLFRPGTTVALGTALRRGRGGQLALETLTLVVGLGVLGWLSPAFLLCYWLPAFYLGWALAQLENYYEHAGARDVGRRGADAVSYYGRVYNALLCNEGYHQEHHYRPRVHWTERPAVREALAGVERTVAAHPPLLGFLER